MEKIRKIHEEIEWWKWKKERGNQFNIDGKQPIDAVIKTLQHLKEECKKTGYHNIMIDINAGYESIMIDVWGDRPETKEEKDRKLLAASKAKQKRQEEKIKKDDGERKEYERLRAKFEKT